jgi:hypothetical protein
VLGIRALRLCQSARAAVYPFDNFIYGAPPMAPLLFPNLMMLGIGLWQMRGVILQRQ